MTISSVSAGCITADGPSSSTDGICTHYLISRCARHSCSRSAYTVVINQSNIVLAPNAASGTSGEPPACRLINTGLSKFTPFQERSFWDVRGPVRASLVLIARPDLELTRRFFLDTARVVFTNSVLGSHINPAGWSIWSTATPNTDHVLFAEFGNTGACFCGAFTIYQCTND